MRIEAVLFDLDGTLIDSTEAIVASFFHTFDALQIERPAREAIVSTIGVILKDQFAGLTDADPDECLRIYRAHYARVSLETTVLHPGAKGLLEFCRGRGLKIGFVTSKLRAMAEPLLEELDVLHFFDVRIGPEDVSRPKPDPEPIQKALDLFGIDPDEAIYIGDTPLDVQAARAASVACLAVTTGYATGAQLHDAKPLALLDGLSQVVNWLRLEG